MPIVTINPRPWQPAYNAGFDSVSKTFKTHLNYIKCIKRLTAGLVISSNTSPTTPLSSNNITKFEQLARITRVSIEGEKNACITQKAYAQIASPWIPVKCYYYLYYLESVFLYLLTSSQVGFSHGGHTAVRKGLLTQIKNRHLIFGGICAAGLTTVIDWGTADSFRTSGFTISPNYHLDGNCENSLRGKLAEYIEIDWKQGKHIANYKTKAAREAKRTDLMPKEFTLLDYFYWMRIKANYRDLDFLDFDNDVNENDAFEYLMCYVDTTFQYADALISITKTLRQSRGMP
jgi:hypothetical protein